MGSQVNCATGEVTAIPDQYATPRAPRYITRYQFKAAVRALNSSKATDLKNHIAGLDEAGQEWWADVQKIRRDSPFVEAARIALGVSQNAVNTLFINAEQYDE